MSRMKIFYIYFVRLYCFIYFSTSKKTERSTRRGTKRPVEDDADEEEEIVIKKPMV